MNQFIRKVAYFLIRQKYIIENKTLIAESGSLINSKSTFEGYNKISKKAFFNGSIGYGSYIGEESMVTGKIGRFCSIGPFVRFIIATHPTSFVSTHPAFYSLKAQSGVTYVEKQLVEERPNIQGEQYPVIVGNDVYIGEGATIIAPVRIGDGAVIAANATVVKDVPPYSIVAGCPAVVKKWRYSNEDIQFLLELKWWEKDEKWIREHAKYFTSLDTLKKQLETEEEFLK